jgi:hypothetical protein
MPEPDSRRDSPLTSRAHPSIRNTVIETLYTVAALVAVVGAVAWIAARLRLPPPILLVLVGMGLAVTPGLLKVELDPDLVLLVLLPPLIYFAAFTMSWQAFRANLRPILLLAIGCVVVTTVAVAGAAHWLLGIPLGVAFMLGAIVSPPDVVAPLAVAERLSIPRRITAVLEGEGLVNDATALILFNLALTAVLTGSFSIPAAARGSPWCSSARRHGDRRRARHPAAAPAMPGAAHRGAAVAGDAVSGVLAAARIGRIRRPRHRRVGTLRRLGRIALIAPTRDCRRCSSGTSSTR